MGYGNFHQAEPPLAEHYHPYSLEVTVMLGGSQIFRTKGSEYCLLAGNAFTNFYEEAHSTGEEPHGVSEFIYFGLDLREAAGFLGLTAPLDHHLFEKAKSWDKRIVKITEEGQELLRRSFGYFAKLVDNREDQDSRMWGQILFLAFLNCFFDIQEVSVTSSVAIDAILNYVEMHIAEALSLEDLMDFSGLSEFQLRERFKTAVRMTPKEYINREKVNQAKIILEQRNTVSLTEIAYSLGFSDSAHFSKVFRQFVSCSPSEYHKRWLRKQ